jgi:DNA-binding IclR family transcriptional regulator
LSVAVNRISDVLEVLSQSPQGVTAPEVASTLSMGRQASSRMLDAMVAADLAEKDDVSKRYRLGLRLYRWGSTAVSRFIPPPFVRYEIAELAESVLHPVFYSIRDGSHMVTVERTVRRGRQTMTTPDYRRNPWSATSSGRALVAFLPPGERNALIKIAPGDWSSEALSENLETVRRNGYASSDAVREGYTLASPVLDERGLATAAIGIGVNEYVAEEREGILRKLLDTVHRVSSNSGYVPLIPDA